MDFIEDKHKEDTKEIDPEALEHITNFSKIIEIIYDRCYKDMTKELKDKKYKNVTLNLELRGTAPTDKNTFYCSRFIFRDD